VSPAVLSTDRHFLRRGHVVLAALLLGLVAGCAHATNYLGPSGPRYGWNLAPSAGPTACADRADRFTVVTFNIQYAKKIDAAIEVLRSTPVLKDLDVLLLQEMDSPGVERIARALGLNALFFPSGVHPRTHREFGAAVLSRWPLEDGLKIVLPYESFGTGLIRTATAATVRCGAHRVSVMSVHLPSPAGVSYDERREQVEVILARAASIDGPLVIGGDFNAHWIGSLFEKAGFTWLNKDLPGTRSLLWMKLQLDHVFVRDLRLSDDRPAAGVADAGGASDHKPLWVRLHLEPDR
jgi:endonuclease/exonuclease/phosphatase family metal-dependent hydrolase